MTSKRKTPQTFGSAYDIPSVRHMRNQLNSFRLLKPFMNRDQTQELAMIEETLNEVVATVDGFYELLGARCWVYHDDLNLPAMREVIAAGDPAAAEMRLIAYYKDREAMKFPLLRLNKLPAMRPRLELAQKAYEDYQAGRYYATVLVLIAVMDGAVNDIDQAQRRGLHTRDADEMVAWDSVTAHHLGLKHAHASFAKTFRKTVSEEVTELYRHGIVHGMVVNYDNVIVATKSLNRLFAVVDWAENPLEQDKPAPTEPSWGEPIARRKKTQSDMKVINSFKPSEHDIQDASAFDDEVVQNTRSYLDAWRSKNYGKLSECFMRFKGDTSSTGRRAGEARELYKDFLLSDYAIKRVQYTGACVSIVEAALVVNQEPCDIALRWARTDDKGDTAARGTPGAWRLSMYGPTNFIR